MGKAACSQEEFIALFKAHGATETAKILGVNVRNVMFRRANLERILDIVINSPKKQISHLEYPKRLEVRIKDGVILIGSDAHYWPDIISTAHRAFVKFCKDIKPSIVCLNGDVLDGAGISRHPPIGWKRVPTVMEEKNAIDERLDEIVSASTGSRFLWTMGNHDARFENKLAQQAPEYNGMPGFSLKEQFPQWTHAISVWVNDSLVIKHRYKGGVHATHNNTVTSGRSIATGHLHSLKVTPFDDYNGTRWGIDSGTLADPYGEQFEYAEDNPMNHRSGFVVLTFKNGELLWPEICRVVDEDYVDFRGELIKV